MSQATGTHTASVTMGTDLQQDIVKVHLCQRLANVFL